MTDENTLRTDSVVEAVADKPYPSEHHAFIAAARSFYDCGPDGFSPGYEQYGDLLNEAEALAAQPLRTDSVEALAELYDAICSARVMQPDMTLQDFGNNPAFKRAVAADFEALAPTTQSTDSGLADELFAVARTLREELGPFEVNAPDLHMTSSLAQRICREAAAALRTDRKAVLEEAAKVAGEAYMKSGNPDFVPACRYISAQLRALAEGAGK